MSKTVLLDMSTKKLVYDPLVPPEAHIESGDTLICESEDANCSYITDESHVWHNFQDLREIAGGGSDPVCGPVYVDGAEAGDFLAIEILKVEPGIWRNGGYTSIQGGCGWMEATAFNLQQPLVPTSRILTFDGEGHAMMNLEGGKEYIKIPLNPFVGCIGVAPKRDRVCSDSLKEEYCGNVDIPQFKEGATVVLRCNVDGGLLSIGDVHAAQGDGEITGCAIECQGRTTVRVTVIKKADMKYYGCPQVNTPEMMGSVGVWSGKNLTWAISRGYVDLVRRINAEYGISESDAYMLLCLCGKVQIGNGSSAVCMVQRSVLEKFKKG